MECTIAPSLCVEMKENKTVATNNDEDIHEIMKMYEKRTKRRKEEEIEDRIDRLHKISGRKNEATLNNIAQSLDNMTNLIATLFKKYSRREPPNYPDPVAVKVGIYIKGRSKLAHCLHVQNLHAT